MERAIPVEPTSRSPAGGRRRQAARYEAGIWRSLFRWLTRRARSDDPEAVEFGYASQVTPILLAFIGLAALEIPVLPLLLPWAVVRYSLLVLGGWSLLWMLGLLASLRVYPHTVGATELRVRSGFQLDLRIPWDRVSTVRLVRASSGRKLQVEELDTRAVLAVQRTTNVELILREPVVVKFVDGRDAQVDSVRLRVDAPKDFVATAHARLRTAEEQRSDFTRSIQ